MDVTLHGQHVSRPTLYRVAAAACGAALVLLWMVFVAGEAIEFDQWVPNIYGYNQAIVLAALFASYAIGWRHELVGGILAIVGTVAFFVVGYCGTLPGLSAVWFAAPGVLYLLAWSSRRREDLPLR